MSEAARAMVRSGAAITGGCGWKNDGCGAKDKKGQQEGLAEESFWRRKIELERKSWSFGRMGSRCEIRTDCGRCIFVMHIGEEIRRLTELLAGLRLSVAPPTQPSSCVRFQERIN